MADGSARAGQVQVKVLPWPRSSALSGQSPRSSAAGAAVAVAPGAAGWLVASADCARETAGSRARPAPKASAKLIVWRKIVRIDVDGIVVLLKFWLSREIDCEDRSSA